MKHWVLGEFKTKRAVLEAAKRLRAAGFHDLDIHSAYPIEEADEVLSLKKSRLPIVGLLAGIGGATGAYVIQWFTNAVQWPINVGNRPAHSGWTSIPITFETMVLAASITLFLGVFAVSRLPHVSHPFFEVAAFQSATIDAFWLSAEVAERDREKVKELLSELQASVISEVSR